MTKIKERIRLKSCQNLLIFSIFIKTIFYSLINYIIWIKKNFNFKNELLFSTSNKMSHEFLKKQLKYFTLYRK